MKTSVPNSPQVLIADDQAVVTEALRLLLKGEGFKVRSVNNPSRALDAARESEFDAALVDLNYMRVTTSGQEGLDLLEANVKEEAGGPFGTKKNILPSVLKSTLGGF